MQLWWCVSTCSCVGSHLHLNIYEAEQISLQTAEFFLFRFGFFCIFLLAVSLHLFSQGTGPKLNVSMNVFSLSSLSSLTHSSFYSLQFKFLFWLEFLSNQPECTFCCQPTTNTGGWWKELKVDEVDVWANLNLVLIS